MTERRYTEVVGSIRQSVDTPRQIEGIAIPYGVVSGPTELTPGSGISVREAWLPGAFKADVERWMAREDGRRAAYRPSHGDKPVGAVTYLGDTPEGVAFRATIFGTPAGDEYLEQVNAGLNGVSAEVSFPPVRASRNGTVVHREGRMHAIAGSLSPAYDGARVALRDSDMEEDVAEQTRAERDDVSVTVTTELTPPIRAAIESQDAAEYRSPIVVTREADIYRRDATWSGEDERGQRYSLLSDGWKARNGDSVAAERQARYFRMVDDVQAKMARDVTDLNVAQRAGDVVVSEVPGAYPNEYLPGLLTPRILKGRPMGSFFQRFAIADATPKIYAKVTTSTTVAVQSAENANPAASDLATTAVTITPALYGAETVVSRQVLDGSQPAAEAMIIQDMIEAYAQASELVIVTAVEAGASASGTAITAATPYAGATGNVVKYATTRFNPAGGQFVPSALFAVLIVQPDTSSLRPLLAWINPQNADGTAQAGGMGANIFGADVRHSYASTTNVVVTARAEDYVIFESPIARFSYDAVTGPSAVRIGVWAYLACGARLGGLKVTAA